MQMFMQANTPRRAGLVAALLVTGMGLAMAPRASAAQPAAQERIQISDLDLSTAAGMRMFEQRVDSAIRRVCKAHEARPVYRSLDQLHGCQRQAWRDVRAQLAAIRPAARLASRN
jgi:UrcA family protein